MMEAQLSDTVDMMLSSDYRERFRAEYLQTRIRKDKLASLIKMNAEGKLDFVPTCPIALLIEQYHVMSKLCSIYEERARIEEISL